MKYKPDDKVICVEGCGTIVSGPYSMGEQIGYWILFEQSEYGPYERFKYEEEIKERSCEA
jgi:hypothetical protein